METIDYKKRPRIKRKKTLSEETEKTIKALIVTLAILIVVLATTFVATLSKTNQKGYSLEQEKLRNEHLKTENTTLLTKITEATTFGSLENSEKVENMTEMETKIFVTEEDNSIR